MVENIISGDIKSCHQGKKVEDKEKKAVNFNTIQLQTDKEGYTSILEFHLDLLKACKSLPLHGPASHQQKVIDKMKEVYFNAIELVFPWFNVKQPAMYYESATSCKNAVKPPNGIEFDCWDHHYASFEVALSNYKTNSPDDSSQTYDYSQNFHRHMPDTRKCQFCGQLGDREERLSGRLLYYRHNEWVHVNCSLWSSEVYEEVDGSLQNVGQALSRGSKLTCTQCGKRGATIGCNQKFCDANFHFECGIAYGATYKDDKKVFCVRHFDSKGNDPNVPKMKDFRCLRTVHIDVEMENKNKKVCQRKPRRVDLRNITLRVGSLTVKSLGHLRLAVSDTRKSLIPIDFSCSRLFWSTFDPNRRVQYHCRINLVLPNEQCETEDKNLVVNHDNTTENWITEHFKDFEHHVRKVNLEETQIRTEKLHRALIDDGKPVFTILPVNKKNISKFAAHLSYESLYEENKDETAQCQIDKECDLGPPNSSANSRFNLKTESAHVLGCDALISSNTADLNTQKSGSYTSLGVIGNLNLSPTKRLNKAISNVINRISPNKNAYNAMQETLILKSEELDEEKIYSNELEIHKSQSDTKEVNTFVKQHIFHNKKELEILDNDVITYAGSDSFSGSTVEDIAEESLESANDYSDCEVEGYHNFTRTATAAIDEDSNTNTFSYIENDTKTNLKSQLYMINNEFDNEWQEQLCFNQLDDKTEEENDNVGLVNGFQSISSNDERTHMDRNGKIYGQLDGIDDIEDSESSSSSASKSSIPYTKVRSFKDAPQPNSKDLRSVRIPPKSNLFNKIGNSVQCGNQVVQKGQQAQPKEQKNTLNSKNCCRKVTKRSALNWHGNAEVQPPSKRQKTQSTDIQTPLHPENRHSTEVFSETAAQSLPTTSCLSEKNVSTNQNHNESITPGTVIKSNVEPAYNSCELAENSPRKDFSIAGLLSPQETQLIHSINENNKLNLIRSYDKSKVKELIELELDSDDDVVYLPPNTNIADVKTKQRTKGKKPKKGKVEENVPDHRTSSEHSNDRNEVPEMFSPSMANQTQKIDALQGFSHVPGTPALYIPQLLTSDLVRPAAFVNPGQSTTGPNLQYIASLPGNLPISHTAPTVPLIATPTNFQLTHSIGQPHPIAGYMTPQGIIPHPHTGATETNFIVGGSPQITPTSIIHHHIHHSAVNPTQTAVVAPPGAILFNQATSLPQPSYLIGRNNQTYIQNVAANSASSSFYHNIPHQHQSPVLTAQQPFYLPAQQQTVYNAKNGNTGLLNQHSHPIDVLQQASDQTLGKKIARVTPQPSSKSGNLKNHGTSTEEQKDSLEYNLNEDPITALSSMANKPMLSHLGHSNPSNDHKTNALANDKVNYVDNGLSIIHRNKMESTTRECNYSSPTTSTTSLPELQSSQLSVNSYFNKFKRHIQNQQRSVGTQAKLGAPVKVITPRPWKEDNGTKGYFKQANHDFKHPHVESGTSSSRSSSVDISRSSSPKSPRVTTPNSTDCEVKFFSQDSNISMLSGINSLTSSSRCPSVSSLCDEQSTANSYSPQKINYNMQDPDGFSVRRKESKSSSIKFVLQRAKESDSYKIQTISIKDGTLIPSGIEPESAVKALANAKLKRNISKKRLLSMVVNLDNKGNMAHSEEDFANEQIVGIDGTPVASTLVEEAVTKFWKPDSTITNSEKYEKDKTDTKGPHLMYEICSDDGFKAESSDPSKLWKLVFEAVQEARIRHSMNPLSNDLFGQNGLQMLGLTHDALAFLLEQLPGATKTKNYEFKHHKQTEGHKQKLIAETLNPSGCARSETFKNRKPYDIFSWLANPHRQFPDDLHRPVEFGQENILADPDPGIGGGQLVSALKRATSLDLPMAMRFRHLAKNAKEAVGVFSSSIHGRGLYCKRTISAGEMVIEYAGEEIRAILCDKRERK